MSSYDHKAIEGKWQQYWEDHDIYKTGDGQDKQYVLDMFPYPSGDGLHVGHVEGYTATDIYTRFLRMQGKSVLHPMGWDAFGLPAENYAIKTGIHPEETTKRASDNFRQQIKRLGLSYDWSREIDTHSPEYYKWTQWLFLELFNNDLAYRKTAKVNWCESCKTVLANEQVQNGACERCGHDVTQKDLKQWFFEITKYAEALHSDLEGLDWPTSTKENQRNWIGKSKGAYLSFQLADRGKEVEVFTTRPDTIYGATYLVLAPEHPLVAALLPHVSNQDEVVKYVAQASKKTDLERQVGEKEKTGVELSGIVAINPATEESIPVYIADYVLIQYGTGAIMAVPAHDERDHAFAKQYDLPVQEVITPPASFDGSVYTGDGLLQASGPFTGRENREALPDMVKAIGGRQETTYKLRDWLISRQRYWGVPIPIAYDPGGNPHPVPPDELPWTLPLDVEFKPTGVSPLRDSKELHERVVRVFGEGFTPEYDTMDTFVCSSWYYLRFIDPHNDKKFADSTKLKEWMPVDLYMGGAEHTVLHLLYARFITKFLHEKGHVSVNEPFQALRHQGMILAEDGRKMSKSLGNVINPDDVVLRVGADALRVYEMFMGPLDQAIPWNTDNMVGSRRFLERVFRLHEQIDEKHTLSRGSDALLHQTIKKVTEDILALKFNTAISAMMVLLNALEDEGAISTDDYTILLSLLAPFAPHVTEELYHRCGGEGSIHTTSWPSYDPQRALDETRTIVVQINGKVRGQFESDTELDEQQAEQKALEIPKVQELVGDASIKRVIYVPNKLVNIVV